MKKSKFAPVIAVAFIGIAPAAAEQKPLYDDRDCQLVADRLTPAVPGLKFGKLQKVMDGTAPSDIYFKHPNAREVWIACAMEGIKKEPSVNADWQDSFPPSGYFDLIAQMAAVVLKMPPDGIRANVVRCQEGARDAKDETNDFDADDGLAYQCSSFGGGSQVTVLRPLIRR